MADIRDIRVIDLIDSDTEYPRDKAFVNVDKEAITVGELYDLSNKSLRTSRVRNFLKLVLNAAWEKGFSIEEIENLGCECREEDGFKLKYQGHYIEVFHQLGNDDFRELSNEKQIAPDTYQESVSNRRRVTKGGSDFSEIDESEIEIVPCGRFLSISFKSKKRLKHSLYAIIRIDYSSGSMYQDTTIQSKALHFGTEEDIQAKLDREYHRIISCNRSNIILSKCSLDSLGPESKGIIHFADNRTTYLLMTRVSYDDPSEHSTQIVSFKECMKKARKLVKDKDYYGTPLDYVLCEKSGHEDKYIELQGKIRHSRWYLHSKY